MDLFLGMFIFYLCCIRWRESTICHLCFERKNADEVWWCLCALETTLARLGLWDLCSHTWFHMHGTWEPHSQDALSEPHSWFWDLLYCYLAFRQLPKTFVSAECLPRGLPSECSKPFIHSICTVLCFRVFFLWSQRRIVSGNSLWSQNVSLRIICYFKTVGSSGPAKHWHYWKWGKRVWPVQLCVISPVND